jgi:hypothetical protein
MNSDKINNIVLGICKDELSMSLGSFSRILIGYGSFVFNLVSKDSREYILRINHNADSLAGARAMRNKLTTVIDSRRRRGRKQEVKIS